MDTIMLLPPPVVAPGMTQNGLVSGTVLVDGFVQAGWKVQTTRHAATLAVVAYGTLSRKSEAALRREGDRLLGFAAPGTSERAVVLSAGG